VGLHQVRLFQCGVCTKRERHVRTAGRSRSHHDSSPASFPPRRPAQTVPGFLLGESEIQTFAGTDYAFRVFVAKPLWSNVLAALAEETDYDNFKSEVARHLGKDGIAYEKSLHDVWDVMYGLQR